ncbi:unnamed protein product [Kuraishia capsulata CBS 1993]|uniref:Suppressor of forked domain-containing protein n=1 Tax=Kuraishia capsulata CBS 1993 TaxID=1382522 RepID=W6MY51_9ASCO|nr:uncharacterized protein KUCA_T00006020001 [Kuraishia capsulata CBS 1993]CDK30025.1 unnamed protein product [Kuraishia capsulata CBS 1993]
MSFGGEIADSAIFQDYPLWKPSLERVSEDVNEVDAWDQLVRILESVVFGYSNDGTKPKPPPELLKSVTLVFDSFLGRFPLFFAFWKNYVAVSYQLEGLSAAIKVFDKALSLAPYSLDIWSDYLSVIVANKALPVEAIRAAFEEACSSVGRQYLSHPVWDAYLEWEASESGESSSECLAIILRLLELPLHQYAKYFTRFYELKPYFAITDLIPADRLATLTATPIDALDVDTSAQIIDDYFNALFESTQKGTNERWAYESAIKEFDFSLNEVPAAELAAWEAYLDYEELNGITDQIRCVYERALVPTASSEVIWKRYLRWLLKTSTDHEDLEAVFKRCHIFVPEDKPEVRFMFARYHEKLGALDAAKAVYLSLLGKGVGVAKYLGFLERTKEEKVFRDGCDALINSLYPEQPKKKAKTNSNGARLAKDADFVELQNTLTEQTSAMAVVYVARYRRERENSRDCRNFFTAHYKLPALRSCTAFWTLFFDFEASQRNTANMYNILEYVCAQGQIPITTINEMIRRYLQIVSRCVGVSVLASSRLDLVKLLLETDSEAPTHARHFLKQRLSQQGDEPVEKRLAAENGHPGIVVEKRPRLVNPVDPLNVFEVQSLPNFKHAEKATAPIVYPDVESV